MQQSEDNRESSVEPKIRRKRQNIQRIASSNSKSKQTKTNQNSGTSQKATTRANIPITEFNSLAGNNDPQLLRFFFETNKDSFVRFLKGIKLNVELSGIDEVS
jgi:hypothetical protein